MSDCECLPRCPFFNDQMEGMDTVKNMMKRRYCQGDSSGCARHMVFEVKGSSLVPKDLFPNDVARAQSILAE